MLYELVCIYLLIICNCFLKFQKFTLISCQLCQNYYAFCQVSLAFQGCWRFLIFFFHLRLIS